MRKTIQPNADGYANAWPRGTYNNPLSPGETAPAGVQGRYVYTRQADGDVTKTINPSF